MAVKNHGTKNSNGHMLYYETLLLLRNNSPKTVGQQEVTIVLDNGTTKELSNKDASIVTRSNNIIAEQDGSKIVYKKVSIENDDLGEPLVYNTLNVPYGKKFEIVLSDGTQVYLNSGSSLTYPTAFYASGPRDVELTGEAYFGKAFPCDNPHKDRRKTKRNNPDIRF